MNKINKLDGLTLFIFKIMLICVLILRWAFDTNILMYISLAMPVIYMLFFKKNIVNGLVPIMLLVLYIIVNLLLFDDHPYYKSELLVVVIAPICVAFCFDIFSKTNYFDKYEFYKRLALVLNWYYFINALIIIMQILIPGFLVHNFSNNSFYLDQVCGLIGNNGTHRLSVLCLACIYLNIVCIILDKKHAKQNYFMTLYIIISSLIISIFNDNKFYYILLGLFFLPIIFNFKQVKKYIFKQNKFSNRKLIISFIFIIICIVFLICYFIYRNIYINNVSLSLLKTERMVLFDYALNAGSPNKLFGHGIGSIMFLFDPQMPEHFGMCELTSRIYTGGYLYLFLMILVFSTFFAKYFNVKKFKNKLFIFLSLISFCYYTQAFSMIDMTFLICLLYYFLSKYYSLIENDTSEEEKKNE